MLKEMPYILSLAYKDRIDRLCVNLKKIGLRYHVMYLVFNNGKKIVLSNIYSHLKEYYLCGHYKVDYSYSDEIISGADHYLCDQTKSISDDFKDLLEKKYGVCRSYYIVRSCSECTLVFGAIKGEKSKSDIDVYNSTIVDFEDFCISFLEGCLDIIRYYFPEYKNSFVLSSKHFRKAMIKREVINDKLTNREVLCLWWSSRGKSAKEIARLCGIGPSTVEQYHKNIRRKFGCSTLVEAVVEGIYRGIIQPEYPNFEKRDNRSYSEAATRKNMEEAKAEMEKTNLFLLNEDLFRS